MSHILFEWIPPSVKLMEFEFTFLVEAGTCYLSESGFFMLAKEKVSEDK